MYKKLVIASLFASTVLCGAENAQTLKVALSSEATAVDPHYHDLTPNNALAAHIFDSLTGQDEQQKLHPALAESWENDGKNKWTFKLREGVKFSDGTPFTADDVLFTFCRALLHGADYRSFPVFDVA
ncbi:ABC transporter substrate-binding protein, partial [Brucella gallinifaecis]|uniref:ABC transporter substrate-binding protein n=1 Tax=Brucella gallinifaecis TaxID=215590 RepID=UPI00235FBB8E